MTTGFATRLRRRDLLVGVLVRMPNEGLVELAALVGLDFVVLDTEHGPGDQLALSHHLTAAAGRPVLVRIADQREIGRVLDLGAAGIVAPHISSAAQAREVVAAAHYPPIGRRGFAGYTSAGTYGLTPAAEHHRAGQDTVVIAMIEDADGLAVAAEIAAVPGIDGLLLGAADFTCDLGIVGRTEDPRVAEAGTTVRRLAHGADRAAVAIVSGRAAARRELDAGTDVVVYNAAHALGELFADLAGVRPEPWAQATGVRPRQQLVLLSGMLGDASVWDEVAAALVDVAIVRPGRIDLDDSVPEMAASVLAEAPPRFALAGHSLGGIVALEVMRQAPDRVTRLALVNASGRGPSEAQQSTWAQWSERTGAGQFAEVAAELARLTLPPSRRDDAALVARNERMANTVGPDGFRRQLAAQTTRPDSLATLERLTGPVLVVAGEQDEVCPPRLQEEIVARCPGAVLVRIAEAGHMSPLERPVEVARHLRHWLGDQ